MANKYAINSFSNVATPEGAGQPSVEKFITDFTDLAAFPTGSTLGVGDTIQIGLVPAGHKLVPHLCRLDMIPIDTNGAPTGDYSIGDGTTSTALKASTASETAAATISGEDWALSTAEIGSDVADTPILITIINASATRPATGKITFWQCIRPWKHAVDVAS